jgi:hypothetical protein
LFLLLFFFFFCRFLRLVLLTKGVARVFCCLHHLVQRLAGWLADFLRVFVSSVLLGSLWTTFLAVNPSFLPSFPSFPPSRYNSFVVVEWEKPRKEECFYSL